ncbi:L,D-transpeptidase family protein [Paenibacillus spongiae]|uniref:L,D-transpeptidase family protein n=1 Tax=Paenibacillus spongiae TaxID=2909671 RepID=A0ABY5SK10_9BACL|nr:L,D-transpeptidase family protein [Paenibacillus spongiae]UVI33010.1 L,D-transpeptidase family protein [Paenibacillus spongiae]
MGKSWKRCIIATLAFMLSGIGVFASAANAASSKTVDSQLIVVNKKTNQLAFFEDGQLVKTFSVGTGKTPELTPEGKFKIVNKIKNRPYYKEGIPGGDPSNPLGDRWIGLDVNGTKGTTYAIHGNNNPKSIGKYVSAGCIRMHNDSVHWLFDQVKINSYAVVTSSKKSFEQIAEDNGYRVGAKPFNGSVYVNGALQQLKSTPILVDSRIFIPMRELFELLGATVVWDNKTMTVTAYAGDRIIVHKPKTSVAIVNGESISMTESRFDGNTVMLPLRDISALSQYGVEWNGATNSIYLTSAAPQDTLDAS